MERLSMKAASGYRWRDTRLGEMGSFSLVGGWLGRVFLVDFAGKPVAVEDRFGDHPWCDGVADAVQPADAGGRELLRVTGQFGVHGVARRLLGDEHDPVAGGGPGVAVTVMAYDRPGADRGDGRRCAHPDSSPVQVGPEHVTLQGLVADGREYVERGDQAHRETVASQQFGYTGRDVVAVGVVHQDVPAGWPLSGAGLFRGEHVRQARVRSGHRVRMAGLDAVAAPH